MISLQAFWMGRDRQYAGELTDEIRENAEETLGKVNALLERAGFENINAVASGWRPRVLNDVTSNAGKKSKHITAEAIDIPDADRKLAHWCLDNLDVLQEIGLWMENPRWTWSAKGNHWLHLQIVPPESGRRVYVPSNAPPLDPDFPMPENVA